MAEMLINNWGGGIGDDTFLARAGECLDMENIDIRTTPRKISCDQSFLGAYATITAPYSDTLSYVTETIDGVVQSYGSHCYINSTNIDTLVAGADKHITIGSNFSDYNATTNPEGVRHFFFTYNGTTNPIKIVGRSGGVNAVITTINTSGGASPANIANARTTAVSYVWEGAILFARDNKIFELNPSTNILSTGATAPASNTGARIILEIGAIVKDIYYFNGQVVVIYTISNTTKIVTFSVVVDSGSPSGYYYRQNAYIDTQIGEKCFDSVCNGQFIYWISPSGIWTYSGNSELVKRVVLSSSSVCGYNKGILRIADVTTFYEYGVQKPLYGNPLTKKINTQLMYGVTENYVITYGTMATAPFTTGFFQDGINTAYKNSTYIFHPYTAGQFGINKKGLGIVFGYTLPRGSYTDSSIQCSITVSVQTYDMYASNPNTYTTIATITDKTKTSKDIMFTEISKALGDAGYSDEVSLFKIKITLNAGDPYSAYGNTLFRKTPEVYDIYFTHEEIKRSI